MNRLDLFPISTKIENDTLTIAGQNLASLASRYLTPLYLYDRSTLDFSAKTYTDALSANYPALAHITYAGKAFLCTAIAQWTQSHDLFVDCTGEGEIAIAVAGGVPRERILVHGVNKSDADLKAAVTHAATIVVDNLHELSRIAKYELHNTSLWLRLLPGVTVTTHHTHTQTGHHESKFGMTREELLEAAAFCKTHNLPLNGHPLSPRFKFPRPGAANPCH
jgi:diaminopimelate decarboxylase